MRGVLIVSRFWTNFFSAGKAVAITIFPLIFVANKQLATDKVLINHERIHLRQAWEMLVIPFYLWYLLEFGIRFLQCRDFRNAYLALSFEREAYTFQADLTYLRTRKRWSFLRFIKK